MFIDVLEQIMLSSIFRYYNSVNTITDGLLHG